jgi:hypothetical protein
MPRIAWFFLHQKKRQEVTHVILYIYVYLHFVYMHDIICSLWVLWMIDMAKCFDDILHRQNTLTIRLFSNFFISWVYITCSFGERRIMIFEYYDMVIFWCFCTRPDFLRLHRFLYDYVVPDSLSLFAKNLMQANYLVENFLQFMFR